MLPGMMAGPAFVGGGAAGLKVQDVFAATAYTGTGSTQSITNGVNLTAGGMVWLKHRTSASYNHRIFDTVRGVTNALQSNTTGGDDTAISNFGLTAFNSNGFQLKTDYAGENVSGASEMSWSFAKAAKFFDIQTAVADSNGSVSFTHNLGVSPGMVIMKARDDSALYSGDWWVWHRGLSSQTRTLFLNKIEAESNNNGVVYVGPDAFTFNFNFTAGKNIVAYFFAHDTDTTNGIIQCGSYAGNGANPGNFVTLGWEPQFLMIKRADSGSFDWCMIDTARGINNGSSSPYLAPNSSAAEITTNMRIDTSSTGFQATTAANMLNNASGTYIYMAIRKGPM